MMECQNASMRVNDRGIIKFRFMYRPEFIKEGSTILFREGRTKGFGVITKVHLPKKGQNPNIPAGGGRKHNHGQGSSKKPGAKYGATQGQQQNKSAADQSNTASKSAAASTTKQ